MKLECFFCRCGSGPKVPTPPDAIRINRKEFSSSFDELKGNFEDRRVGAIKLSIVFEEATNRWFLGMFVPGYGNLKKITILEHTLEAGREYTAELLAECINDYFQDSGYNYGDFVGLTGNDYIVFRSGSIMMYHTSSGHYAKFDEPEKA